MDAQRLADAIGYVYTNDEGFRGSTDFECGFGYGVRRVARAIAEVLQEQPGFNRAAFFAACDINPNQDD